MGTSPSDPRPHGRRGTTRLPVTTWTGSSARLSVVTRTLIKPWRGFQRDGRTSSTWHSTRSSSPGRTGRGSASRPVQIPALSGVHRQVEAEDHPRESVICSGAAGVAAAAIPCGPAEPTPSPGSARLMVSLSGAGSILACVGVHVPLRAPVVALPAIGGRAVVRRHVRAVFAGVPADRDRAPALPPPGPPPRAATSSGAPRIRARTKRMSARLITCSFLGRQALSGVANVLLLTKGYQYGIAPV